MHRIDRTRHRLALLTATVALAASSAPAADAPKGKPYLEDVLENLDLDRPELATIKASAGDAAAAALANYFRTRASFHHPVDRARRPGARGTYASGKTMETALQATRNILIASPDYPPHDFGPNIDWSRNPTKDSEWLWQLHRMSSWDALARAWWHTGDEKYAQAWARQFLDWVKNNLVSPRPPYAWRTIEAGIRGHEWIGLYQHFVDSKAFTPEVCVAFLAACLEHGRYLDAALKNQPHGNNWRLMEAEGLGAIALCFPEFKGAKPWRERSFAVLKDNIKRQVRSDGMHYEQCFNYHEGCIAWFARTAQLAKMNGQGEEFGSAYFATIEAMCDVLLKMSFPDGTTPQFGDGHTQESVRGTLVEWADFFKRDDFRYAGTGGREGRAPADTATALKESGFYSLRSGWGGNATCLVLKCGPDGGWHCQPDNGTFEVFAGGRRLTPDSGCYIYSGDDSGRQWFRRTRVHQTLTLDGADTRYAPRLLLWKPGEDLDALVVENAGAAALTHRRAVLFVKRSFFVMVDEAAGGAAGDVRLHFQLAPGGSRLDPGTLRAQTGFADGTNLLIAALPGEGVAFEKEEGQVSFAYGERRPRPAFALTAKKEASTKALRFVTVLVPHEGAAPAVRIKPSGDATAGGDRAEYDVSVGPTAARVGYDIGKGEAWSVNLNPAPKQ